MSRTIVLIHGAFVTSACWDPFKGYFESRGYTCLAPDWPHKDQPVETLRANPPKGLGGLGMQEIVAHYQRIIEGLDAPPILIGHSYGGLFVQMLLDRGLGAVGVAIDPAPPKGVFPFFPTTVWSLLPVLLTPFGWQRAVRLTPKQFNYAFVNTLSKDEQRKVYETFVTPETGRIFFQAAFSLFNRAAYVNFENDTRPPLLIIAGSKDHIVPAAMNRLNYRRYRDSDAVTDFREFEDRSHWILAQPGWEEVATFVEMWSNRILGSP